MMARLYWHLDPPSLIKFLDPRICIAEIGPSSVELKSPRIFQKIQPIRLEKKQLMKI